jgi:hypothetical protein
VLIEPREVVANARIVFEQRAMARQEKVTSWLSDPRVVAKLAEYANGFVQRTIVAQMEAHEVVHGTMRRDTTVVVDLATLSDEVWTNHFKDKLRLAYSIADLRLAYSILFGDSGWGHVLSDDGRCVLAFPLWDTCGSTTVDMGRETRCRLEPHHEGLHDDGSVQWTDAMESTETETGPVTKDDGLPRRDTADTDVTRDETPQGVGS